MAKQDFMSDRSGPSGHFEEFACTSSPIAVGEPIARIEVQG
jgi:hypothetical protein